MCGSRVGGHIMAQTSHRNDLGYLVDGWSPSDTPWKVTPSGNGEGSTDASAKSAVIPQADSAARRAVRIHEAIHAAVGEQQFRTPWEKALEEMRVDAIAHSQGVDTSRRLDEYDLSLRTVPTVHGDAARVWLQLASAACTPESLAKGTPAFRSDVPKDLEELTERVFETLTPEEKRAVTAAAETLYRSPAASTRDVVARSLTRRFSSPSVGDPATTQGGNNTSDPSESDAKGHSGEEHQPSPGSKGKTPAGDKAPSQDSATAAQTSGEEGEEQSGQPGPADSEKEGQPSPGSSDTGQETSPDESSLTASVTRGSEPSSSSHASSENTSLPSTPTERTRVEPLGCAGESNQEETQQADGSWKQSGPMHIQRPTPRPPQDPPSELSRGKREHAIPRSTGSAGSSSYAIGHLVIDEHTNRSHSSVPITQPAGATDTGQIPEVMERWAEDKQVFRTRRSGGTILIDCSGSMSWDWEELKKAIKRFPTLCIAVYSGQGGSGRLCILGKDGRWADLDPSHMSGGNEVDLEALTWLSAQKGPRVWLSDGYICGGRVGALGISTGAKEARSLAARAKIIRASSIDTALGVLRVHGMRAIKGSYNAHSEEFIPSDWVESRSWRSYRSPFSMGF